jgi:hypothetical protein
MNEKEWLIWSIEHNAWWKPNQNGYTQEKTGAGRYTFEQACKIVRIANIYSNNAPNEAMIKYEH